jgi:hypothetical protein
MHTMVLLLLSITSVSIPMNEQAKNDAKEVSIVRRIITMDSDDSVSIVLRSSEDSIDALLKSAIDASVIEPTEAESPKKYHVTRGVQ